MDKSECVLKPEGNIAADKVAVMRSELLELVTRPGLTLVIDLADVKIVDSMGIGLLITACNSLKKTGGSLRLLNASTDVKKMLTLMRLDKHFEIA